MEDVAIKLLGKILEEAGLISEAQVNAALEIQSKYGQFKFGTILVTLGILKHKTVDFFVEQFPKISEQPTIYPIGYYLQKAALLDSEQTEIILQQQKQTGTLFGQLAIEKGWLKPKTLEFFLKNFDKTVENMELVSPPSQKITHSFDSEANTSQTASHYSLLKEVFFWTGGHPLLTQHICQIISNSEDFVPAGVEVIWVEKLVQDCVLDNWKSQPLGEFLQTIEQYILNNKLCQPRNLLKLYLDILQQETVRANKTLEKGELIKVGLVIEQEGNLTVSNRIYQSIFNSDWVEQQLLALEKKSQIVSNTNYRGIKFLPKNTLASAAIKLKNEPFTQVAALVIVLGLLLTSPIIIFFNNSYHKTANTENTNDSESASQLQAKSPLCTGSIPVEFSSREDWRIRLEQKRQELKEEFPDNCRNNLDKLIVLTAIKLGKENRVLDGINYLCQINANSESFKQAQFWLTRWYNSPTWGTQTQYYLNSIEDCPTAKNLLSAKL